MMAALQLARRGWEVHLYEKNEKLGKKIYITGKGRCNLTNACDVEELFSAVMSNPKFLYSAFYGFTNADTIRFFEEAGVPLKVERGKRVFPVSDHASDVIKALSRRMEEYGVKTHLETEVSKVLVEDAKACGVRVRAVGNGMRDTSRGRAAMDFGKSVRRDSAGPEPAFVAEEDHRSDVVIVATGGLSYPLTGSTGDGYRFARETGHTVTPLSPSLVSIRTAEDYVPRLAGLSLKNVEFTVTKGKKRLFRDFGEMMFTHQGVSGPVVLSASAVLGKYLKPGDEDKDGPAEGLSAWINLKPALNEEQLDARILREFEAAPNRQFKNAIASLFPSSLVPVMVELGGISPLKPVHSVTKEERRFFASRIRQFPLTLTSLGSFHEAVITRGGVQVRQIDPSTMESRLVSGLYFVGEVLDLDALTGGFNLQIAWSTGAAAAEAVSRRQQ